MDIGFILTEYLSNLSMQFFKKFLRWRTYTFSFTETTLRLLFDISKFQHPYFCALGPLLRNKDDTVTMITQDGYQVTCWQVVSPEH